MASSDNRRSFLKKSTAALVGLSIEARRNLLANPKPRVGIVGGGLAGVSSAWLLDGVADTFLFENRPSLGGHTHTIPVEVENQVLLVDVGAQFVAPGPHPTYFKLLEVLGLLTPEDPDHDLTIEAELSITSTEEGQPLPRFVSPTTSRRWPIRARWNTAGLLAFLAFSQAAKELCQEGDYLLPLDDWLRSLPIREEEREQLILPLLAAMVGAPVEQTRRLSARSAVIFVACALPENPLDPFLYSNSLIGLGGNTERLSEDTGTLTTYLNAPLIRVRPLPDGRYRLRNRAGIFADVDIVIFASPPYVTGRLLGEIPQLAGAARILQQFEYFKTEISIHRDPIYMPQNPLFWSAYNPHLIDGHSEASVWLGVLRPVPPGQAPIRLFKSWATARPAPPQEEVFRRAFLHPLITPDFIQTQRELEAFQGTAGIWFAGSYTKEVDSQETALLSAVRVVEELFPDAPNLLRLQT
ncbi:MAG: FAD-dependent oxidoreductase [Acidobacteriota bacterium]